MSSSTLKNIKRKAKPKTKQKEQPNTFQNPKSQPTKKQDSTK
jgi:hypothetical protein